MKGSILGHSNWRLKVTAGPDYNEASHQMLHVNSDAIQFDSDRATVSLNVRIQDYKGKANVTYECTYC